MFQPLNYRKININEDEAISLLLSQGYEAHTLIHNILILKYRGQIDQVCQGTVLEAWTMEGQTFYSPCNRVKMSGEWTIYTKALGNKPRSGGTCPTCQAKNLEAIKKYKSKTKGPLRSPTKQKLHIRRSK